MVYNKTKRGLEKAAGIVGIIVASLEIITAIYAIVYGCYIASYYYDYAIYIVSGIFLLAFTIINLIFCAKITKSPVDENGIVKNTNKFRICVIVFSAISGNWVTLGLEIAVICLKDVVPAKRQAEVNASYIGQAEMYKQQVASLDAKVAELKHLKELGIIDEEVYKKAIEKIINDTI